MPDQKVADVDSSESEQYSEHIEENEETIDGVQEEEKQEVLLSQPADATETFEESKDKQNAEQEEPN